MNNDRAYLSNDKDMIKFQYGEKIIRFRAFIFIGAVYICERMG